MKDNHRIHKSDLSILLKLFTNEDHDITIIDELKIGIESDNLRSSKSNKKKVLIVLSRNKELEINYNFFNIILDFTSLNIQKTHLLSFNYMMNSVNGLRWIYPQNKLKSILAFYNNGSYQGRINKLGINILAKLRADNLISSGSLNIHSDIPTFADSLLNKIDYSYFNIFMGTPGYERKIVLSCFNSNNRPVAYIKVPISAQSAKQIVNEKHTLNRLERSKFNSFVIPRTLPISKETVLGTDNKYLRNYKPTNNFTKYHGNLLNELFYRTYSSLKIYDTEVWDRILNNIYIIRHLHSNKINKSDLRKLISLRDSVDSSNIVPCSLAHSDFTPWNMKLNKTSKKIYLFDWEHSIQNSPALFDLIHFHFQKGILMDNSSFKTILKEIEESCNIKSIQEIIRKHKVDLNLHLRLYILRIASYSWAYFQNQRELTKNQKSQSYIWNQAMDFLLLNKEARDRDNFIQLVHTELKKVPHAFLKLNKNQLSELSEISDLDVAIQKKDVDQIINYCNQSPLAKKVKIRRLSFMSVIEVFFNDDSYLSIDLIHKFKCKSLELISAKSLIRTSYNNGYNVNIPSIPFDLEYAFLFYHLNGANIPEKYYQYYRVKNYTERTKAIEKINTKYDLNITSFFQFCFGTYNRKKLKKIIKSKQSIKRKFINRLEYLKDTTKRIIKSKGFVITFSGVDGVGKSTIIDNVKTKLQNKYRKEVVLLRHRPGILPILSSFYHGKEKAEKIASVNLPRQGKNKNLLSSLIRFSYYFTDYIFGQTYIYFKYIIRGKIVLYDRYYFDFIVDPIRTNIRLNKRFTRALYKLIYKPKFNFLLWNTSEEVFSRKKELGIKTIESLNLSYKNLFDNLNKKSSSSKYLTIKNDEIENTVDTILKEVVSAA
ncbi:MAG: hypothetical protein MK105_07585 [Crocinitomicaceae bacterium]|nr:hypothetical protein [Crocinitomicaceae bacterium]